VIAASNVGDTEPEPADPTTTPTTAASPQDTTVPTTTTTRAPTGTANPTGQATPTIDPYDLEDVFTVTETADGTRMTSDSFELEPNSNVQAIISFFGNSDCPEESCWQPAYFALNCSDGQSQQVFVDENLDFLIDYYPVNGHGTCTLESQLSEGVVYTVILTIP